MYKRLLSGLSIAFGILVTPMLVFAAPGSFKELASFIIGYINLFITVILTATVAYYLYNTAQGIFKMRSGKPDANWQKGMFWGIVGIAVMVSIWGLLWILVQTFGFSVRIQ